jgi:hypothetical protein
LFIVKNLLDGWHVETGLLQTPTVYARQVTGVVLFAVVVVLAPTRDGWSTIVADQNQDATSPATGFPTRCRRVAIVVIVVRLFAYQALSNNGFGSDGISAAGIKDKILAAKKGAIVVVYIRDGRFKVPLDATVQLVNLRRLVGFFL